MEDRRKFVRLDTQLPLHYGLLPSGVTQAATSKELGGGGLRLVTQEHVQPESRIWIELQLPERPLPVAFVAEVVWSERYDLKAVGPVELGVRFLDISHDDLQVIMRHVSSPSSP